jgi:hypothetical protein
MQTQLLLAKGKSFEPDPEFTVPDPLPPMYRDRNHPTEQEITIYTRYINSYNELAKNTLNAMRESGEPKKRKTDSAQFNRHIS